MINGRSSRVVRFVVLLCSPASLLAEGITQPGGVTINISNSGDFQISYGFPPWTFGGKVPGQVTDISGLSSGDDNNTVSTNGPYDELTVSYQDANGNPWQVRLRAYRYIPIATVSFTNFVSVPNDQPLGIFTAFPNTQHHFSNGGWNRAFGVLGWMMRDSPWLFFDDDARSAMLSPLDHPMFERQRWISGGGANGVIALEIEGSNSVLPAGGTYSYIVAFGSGIGTTFGAWGQAYTNMLGKIRPGNQADLSLIMPMLSTDAFATYYYRFDPSLGYEDTLLAVKADAAQSGIRFGITHVDSWWYYKGGKHDNDPIAAGASWKNGGNGIWKLRADRELFLPNDEKDPEGAGFGHRLGSLMAHARWIDPNSPYRDPIPDANGNVLTAKPVSGNVIVDLGLWRKVAQYLKLSGVQVFEQDFLSGPAIADTTFDDELFLDAMAQAMGEQGIALQYCLPVARDILQAFRYPHVHTARASGDGFSWPHWDEELYNSLFFGAGGIWPTVDNFRTTEKRNLLLAVLSAGSLALGDQIGAFVPIPEAIRVDGLIMKPDTSMVPTDATFVAESTAIEDFYGVGNGGNAAASGGTLVLPPVVAYAYSDFWSTKAEYVFAYSRDLHGTAPIHFSPAEFGFAGQVYVYDYFRKTGGRQPADQAVSTAVDSQGAYFVIVPVGPSHIAFLGDLAKYVPLSKQRFPDLSDDGQVNATLQFARGETVTLSFAADAPPTVTAEHGAAGPVTYDMLSGLYQVTIVPDQSRTAIVHIAPNRIQ